MTEKITYASFYERALSRLIDSVFYLVMILTPIIAISGTSDFSLLLTNIYNFVLFVLSVAVIVLPLEICMISKIGGTPGKLLMGIRVQKENGKYLTLKEAFIRTTLGKAVSGLFFGLGYFWILKNDKHQGWHDMIMGSVVVRRISYGWLIGVLILIVFLVIDVGLIVGSIINFINNYGFYSSLLI